VFKLLTECFYKKESKGFKKVIDFRKALLKDHQIISVTDFGAGSRVFRSEKRKVSAISKNAGISKKRALLLNKLTSYLNIENALELGTSVGISSAAIASGNYLQLTTIEGCPETAKVAREYFRKFELDNIILKVGQFEEVLNGFLEKQKSGDKSQYKRKNQEDGRPETAERMNSGGGRPETGDRMEPGDGMKTKVQNQPQTPNHKQQTTNNKPQTPDLIYFDGNHRKEASLHYFEKLLPLVHNDSVFIFDDIHWSKEMEEAWEQIKAHPQVSVSIDTFYWGLVFFRKEQEKEHFTIRL
jgi:predicted O-methyltransferase YrrM